MLLPPIAAHRYFEIASLVGGAKLWWDTGERLVHFDFLQQIDLIVELRGLVR